MQCCPALKPLLPKELQYPRRNQAAQVDGGSFSSLSPVRPKSTTWLQKQIEAVNVHAHFAKFLRYFPRLTDCMELGEKALLHLSAWQAAWKTVPYTNVGSQLAWGSLIVKSFAEIIQQPPVRLGCLHCAKLRGQQKTDSDNNLRETLLNAF